jgi:hypothetical protein
LVAYKKSKKISFMEWTLGVFMRTTNVGGFTEINNIVSEFSFSLYPNPAKDKLMLSLKLEVIIAQATILIYLVPNF